jgi:hypothetical protein
MDLPTLLKQVLLSTMVSLLIFLMINVAIAQLISSTLLTAVDGNSALVVIIFLGFVVAWVVAIVVNLLVSENEHKLRAFNASVFASLGNLLVWVCVSYFFLLRRYPALIPDPDTGSLFQDVLTRGLNYVGSIPRVMGYFAIYILENITMFWIYTLISYAMIYAIFLVKLRR